MAQPPQIPDPTLVRMREVLAACLKDAAEIHRRYFGAMRASDVVAKSRDFDLQTVADVESERTIVTHIRAAFPDHAILTEEAGELARPGAPVRWVVDPLDGTLNFRHGLAHFAISIAAEVEGEAVLGAVYNPIAGELFAAERGTGATLNGAPIRVANATALGECCIAAGLPYDRRERIDRYMGFFREFVLASRGVYRGGSAALDLCFVAAGRFGGYFEESISAWDWAAGRLIVEEAGGRVTDYADRPPTAEGRQVCASNGAIHAAMLAILSDMSR